MKRNKYITTAVAALLAISAGGIFTSCEDFLTEDPKGRLVTEGFFDTENDLIMAVNALYYNVAASQRHTNPYIPDTSGDDMTTLAKQNNIAYQAADEFGLTIDYKGVNDLWEFQYKVIQAANLVIDNADKVNASKDIINIAKGNAYFWRASAYFRLVRVFGQLPVNLHNEPDNNSTPLSSVEEIYKLIEDDLKNAEACNLPTSYEGNGYAKYAFLGSTNVWISKQAVKSLYCAVCMNIAGYPLQKEEYWEKAADLGHEVYQMIENGECPNHLEADYAQIFSYGNNFGAEQIVTVSYISTPGNMSDYSSQWVKVHRFSAYVAGWGDYMPEYKYWTKFLDGPRKRAMIDPQIYIYQKDSETGENVTVDWWATTDMEPYSPEKKNNIVGAFHPMFSSCSINVDADGNYIAAPYDYRLPQSEANQSGAQAHRFIRVGEVYLWFAESAAHAGKYTGEAEAALRKVMQRAYDPETLPAITNVEEQAFEEHGFEVAGYPLALCSRRSDLFRRNRLKDAWQERVNEQQNPSVIVPAGTLTHTFARVNTAASGRPVWKNMAVTYTTTEDLRICEPLTVEPEFTFWSVYQPYPPAEVEKNPNIVHGTSSL